MVPLEMLQSSTNKELDPDAYYALAEALVANPLVFACYGTDNAGVIKSVVLAHVDPRDLCLYVENLFNADLGAEELLVFLETTRAQLQAKAVKLARYELLDLGGK